MWSQTAAALANLSWWPAPAFKKPYQFARGVDPLAQLKAQTGLWLHEKAIRFQARLEVRNSSFEPLDDRYRFVRPRRPRDVRPALFVFTALNRLSLRSPSHELSSSHELSPSYELSLSRISRTGERPRRETGARPTSASEKIRASS
jgi:hypothetical protein